MKLLRRLRTFALVAGLVALAHAQAHGTAIDLDAVGDYVSIPDSPSLSPTQEITLEAWVRIDAHRATGRFIISKHQGDAGGGGRSYILGLAGDGRVRGTISHDGSSVTELFSTAAVSPGIWSHVAATYDGSTLRLYLNGVEVASAAGSGGIYDGVLPVHLGLFTTSNPSFEGDLDEVRVWSVARTAGELRQEMFTELNGSETGLEGYWKFADQDGRDYTSNGNDGTVNGDPGWSQPGFPQPRGTAIDLDASGDYVEIPDSPSLSPTQAMTLEAWIRPRGNSNLIVKHQGDAGGGGRSFAFQANANGSLRGVISHDGSAGNAIDAYSGTGFFSMNVWSHVALTYDSSTMRFYVNGVEVGSVSGAGGIHDGVLPVRIGLFTTNNPSFDGEVDEARVWSVARTAEELRQGMFAELSGGETGLGGYWRFEEQDGRDYTSNGNDGAVLGDPLWSQPGAPGLIEPVQVRAAEMTATYNQTISAPVVLAGVRGNVVSAEVFVRFDGSLLTFDQVTTASTLTDGWTIEDNLVDDAGTMKILKIAAATDQDEITADGTLLEVGFTVNDVRHPAWSVLELAHALLNDGDPAATAVDGSVTLVGVDGTIVSAPTEIIPRWDIDVTVTDGDEDRDDQSADSFAVAVTNGSQTELLTVFESGASTGVFGGSIETAFSLSSSSDDGIVQAQAGDAIQFCYGDSLDSAGNTVERCATTQVIGGHDSQLRTTVVSQPEDTVRVRVIDADLEASVAVSVANARTGEVESIVLSQFAIGDSHFYGRFFTDTQAGSVGDSTMEVAKGDVMVVTYGDTLTSEGGTAVLTDDDEVVDPFGDADGNGNVQAFDAAQVLWHRLQTYAGGAGSLSGLDSLSANVDSLAPFGIIDGYDASLVLRKVVGLVDRFEVQAPQAANHPQPETRTRPKRIAEERALALRVGEGYVSVWVDERAGIVSGELRIEGVAGAVVMGAELGDFLVVSDGRGEELQVVFAGATSVDGPGELLRVYPGVGPGSVRLTRASFNGGRIEARSVEGEGTVRPLSFALYANAPNPFNPQTAIGYALPVAGQVELVVYDVVGQRVRVLVSALRAAGMHEVVWDGRDDSGQRVGSGVYLYRLRARGSAGEWRSDASRPADLRFQQMRRMLLIK